MFNEEYEQLIHDVTRWLQGGPTLEDIRYYVGRVPESDRPLILHAAQAAARDLFARKRALLRGAGMDWIMQEMSESDQLNLIAYFGLYSHDSILRNLQERYPGKPIAFPSSMREWTRDYIRYWTAATLFLALPEQEIQLQLRTSLLALRLTPEQRNLLMADLLQAFLTEERRLKEISDYTKEDADRVQSILDRLTFIPKDRHETLMDVFAAYNRQLLFFRIRTVFLAEEAATAAGANPEAVLLEQNRFHAIQILLDAMEAERLEWTGGLRKRYEVFMGALVEATLPEAIRDGTAAERVRAALAQQPAEDYSMARQVAEEYCATLPMIEEFFDPFSSREFYRQAKQCIDEGALQQLITDVQDSFEASEHPLLQQYARFFYELTHKVLNRA